MYAKTRYKLGTREYHPETDGEDTRAASWEIVKTILEAYGDADFWDLACACRGHIHGVTRARGPQSWIRYLARSGYIVPIDGILNGLEWE